MEGEVERVGGRKGMDKSVGAYSLSASEKLDNMSDPSIRHFKTTRVCLCMRVDVRAGMVDSPAR